MKRIFIIYFCSLLILSGLQAQDLSVPYDQIRQIAERNAQSRWGTVSPGEPLACYSKDDQLIGYRFTWALNNQFPDKESLYGICYDFYTQGDKRAQWGIDQYATMFVSARKDAAVIQDHSKSLSPEYAFGRLMEQKAQAAIGGAVILKRAYYIDFQNQWFCYTNGTDEIYVKVFPKIIIAGRVEFHRIVDKLPGFPVTGDFTSEWGQYLGGRADSPAAQVWIPNHDGNCRFYDWSYGCSPTAAAMLLSYWDYISIMSSNNYAKLIDYYYQRWDGIQGETDYQVPNTNKELAIAMNTDTVVEGGTDRDDIAPGYAIVCNTNNGYNFTCTAQPSGQSVAYYFGVIMSEIGTNDRPIHISIPGHSECCVAYDASTNEIGVHNTWWEGVQWIARSNVERTYTIVPGGDFGYAIQLAAPLGDTQYNHNGNGESFYAGDVYEITWNYDYAYNSYVRIDYSLNGGYMWYIITSNTPNDGHYNWVIPAGLSSTQCRIRVMVYNSSGTYSGCDGSLGNFKIYSGGSLSTLAEDVAQNTNRDPDYFQFTSTSGYWSAVGTRPNVSGEDWDIQLYDDVTFTDVIAASGYSGSLVDYVVIDGNHTSSINRGVQLNRYSGTGSAKVEFEGGSDIITRGTPLTATWTAGDVVEMWDVYLTPGYYKCTLTCNSGTANLGMALYKSSGTAYYASRAGYIAFADAGGAGAGESFGITITAADYYGLCVFANDGNTANFTLNFEAAGQWLGMVSNDWNNAANWSAGYIPVSTTDVTINTGYTYYPSVSAANGVCNNLTIGAGAQLSVGAYDLNVYGSMTVHGQVTETHINADFFVEGDIFWMPGSTASITAAGEIHVNGDWEFMSGANVQLNNGIVSFDGASTAYIRNHESYCYFHDLRNDKTAGYLYFSSSSTDTSLVKGNLDNDNTTSQLILNSGYPVILEGQLQNSGHIYGWAGTFIFDGTTHTINLNTGDYFNNLIISSSGNVTLNDSLRLNGDLTISSGALVAGSYPVLIEGDWNNTVGPAGFSEGTGKVVFNGGNYHQYCSNETFNQLEINKASGGAFRINGTTVTCAAYNWTAGALDVLSGSFTANDLTDDGLFGNYYINPGGTINLYNNDGWVDLNGYLYIYGGTFNVYGGSGTDSWWPFTGNSGITMTGGILDFKNVGIYIPNSGFAMNENITGGTIRTCRGFDVERPDYTPSGGTVEFYGPTDGNFTARNGGCVFDVLVNKGSTLDNGPTPGEAGLSSMVRDRDGTIQPDAPVGNMVSLSGPADLNGDMTITGGVLQANTYTITVAGDWNNMAGTSGFLEGTGTVVFDGPASANLVSNETFYNADLNKTYSGYEGLILQNNMTTTNNLHIIDGTMEMDSPSHLTVNGNLTIEIDAGLNANDSYGPVITVGKNWTNLNTTHSIYEGFDPNANSTVIFNGTSDQYLSTNALREEFGSLQVDKSSGKFRPNDDLYAMLDFQITNGTWEDNVSGLTHTLVRNFTVNPTGSLFNAIPLNTVNFEGTVNSILTYSSGSGYFHNLTINKSAGSSVTQVGSTSLQFDGNLTVNQGLYNMNGNFMSVFGTVNINPQGELSLPSGSSLMMSSSKSLNVNSGGILNIAGSAGSPVTINANLPGAYFNFNVFTGGTIAADYCNFSNLSVNGVYALLGSTVDPLHPFSHCTFANSAPGGTLLRIDNNQTLTIRNAQFPANTWGGASNVSKTMNQGQLYFVDFSGGFSGEDYDNDIFGRVTWAPTLLADATAVPGTICAGSTSQLNANASGGIGPYTYLWGPSGSLSDPASATPVATPPGTTSYTVVVTDALGTQVTDNVTVTVNPLLPVSVNIDASGNPIATGTFVNFTATPVNGGTPAYQWKVNGANVGSGGPVFAYTPANNDLVWCVMTSSLPCISGSPATSNVITMHVIDENKPVAGTIPSPLSLCFDALNTITVAGSGSTFLIQAGASATMIAGVKIRYLDGTRVESGGYMYGHITTSNTYCGMSLPPMVAVVTGVEYSLPEVASASHFYLFPNPATGKFTIAQRDYMTAGMVRIEVVGMRGELVRSQQVTFDGKYLMDLSGIAPGLYFVNIISNDVNETLKLVITR